MRRIDTSTKAVDLFGAGKHGFKNGDPALAILATKLNAEFFNATQEELASLIEYAGLTLSNADNTQLRQAISAMIAASIPAGEDAGSIKAFALAAAPTGWLKANGAAVSRTTYAGLFNKLVTVPGYTAQTFTVTIASPGVFTKTAHGFSNGERVRLSTTGALPTGLNNSTDYFVEKIDANTFYLSLTLLGTRIVTTGTQSGTHSYLQSWFGLGDGSTTFNLPDLRGEFIRGWDDGRGLDTGRVFGAAQMDDFKSHTHTQNSTAGSYSGATGVSSGILSAGVTGATGGAETRPRNVALLVCIKY